MWDRWRSIRNLCVRPYFDYYSFILCVVATLSKRAFTFPLHICKFLEREWDFFMSSEARVRIRPAIFLRRFSVRDSQRFICYFLPVLLVNKIGRWLAASRVHFSVLAWSCRCYCCVCCAICRLCFECGWQPMFLSTTLLWLLALEHTPHFVAQVCCALVAWTLWSVI